MLEERLFAGLFKPLAESSNRRQRFIAAFPDSNMFHNEWHVLYLAIFRFPTLEFKSDFIKLWLTNNKAAITQSKAIDLSEVAFGDEDTFVTFCNLVLTSFTKCRDTACTDEDFDIAIEEFRMQYVTENSINLLEQGVTILSEGYQVNQSRTLAGFDDMVSHVTNGLSRLKSTLNHSSRKGIVVYSADSDEEAEKNSYICNYGIKPLDDVIGGITEGDMISLLAPPKGGKSRLSAFFVHEALIQGISVVTWSIENGLKGIESLIRARHYDWLYNNDADVTKRKSIDAKDIKNGTLDKETKEAEAASWLELRANPKYGKLVNIDEDFDADTFLTILGNAVDRVGAKIVLVDYLQLVSGDGKMSKNERISQCYQRSLQFLQSRKIAGIFPAQIKQSAVGDLGRCSAEQLKSVELRDAGGESSEVIRTPSVLFLLYGNTQMMQDNTLKLISIPSRNSKPFDPVDLYVDFSTCNFTYINNTGD